MLSKEFTKNSNMSLNFRIQYKGTKEQMLCNMLDTVKRVTKNTKGEIKTKIRQSVAASFFVQQPIN